MGQTTSNVARKFFPRQKGQPTSKRSNTDPDGLKSLSVTPYVYTRHGSMYFDEDGDLAHEFYIEVRTASGTIMQRESLDRLRPQGEIELPHPRFNVDFPVVIYEVVQS